MRNNVILAIVILAALGSLSCAGIGHASATPFPLYGMVYGDDGKPVEGVELTLGGDSRVVSDFTGRFAFPSMRPSSYQLLARKAGWEEFVTEIAVTGSGDVLYVSLVSAAGLFQLIGEAMADKDWKRVDALIERARRIDAHRPALRYAEAVAAAAHDRPDRDWRRAIDLATGILAEGYREAYVFLLLADIYEFDVGDPSTAASYLERYATLNSSQSVEERLARLRAMPPAEPPSE